MNGEAVLADKVESIGAHRRGGLLDRACPDGPSRRGAGRMSTRFVLGASAGNIVVMAVEPAASLVAIPVLTRTLSWQGKLFKWCAEYGKPTKLNAVTN